MALDRRDFLRTSAAGAFATFPQLSRLPQGRAAEVVVIGAGAFGGWAAFHLRRMGAAVTLVDAYGPGNSRSTSGDETRGVRSSYGTNETWVLWAKEAIKRWKAWDEEWGEPFKQRLFFPTSDLILRATEDGMIRQSRATWDKHAFKYELLKPDEIRYRYPQIRIDNVGVGLVEPDAGVVRARRATQVVAEAFVNEGGRITIAHAAPGRKMGRLLTDIRLDSGATVAAQTFIFACGPWLGKVFPAVMAQRLRTPIGHVFYYGTPPGDQRFTFPNCPSWNVPGCTGWPALGPDSRGFRVRTGGRPPSDPDASVRWVDYRYHDGPRNILAQWFPDLLKQPLLETRACHYEGSANRNFIIDRHPDFDNVWITGAGNAESFKMGPVLGEYIAKRVLGKPTDSKLEAEFKISDRVFDPTFADPMRAKRMGITEIEELL